MGANKVCQKSFENPFPVPSLELQLEILSNCVVYSRCG